MLKKCSRTLKKNEKPLRVWKNNQKRSKTLKKIKNHQQNSQKRPKTTENVENEIKKLQKLKKNAKNVEKP